MLKHDHQLIFLKIGNNLFAKFTFRVLITSFTPCSFFPLGSGRNSMGLLKKRSSHCFPTFSVGGDGLRAVFTINSVKRLLGRGSSEILKNLIDTECLWPMAHPVVNRIKVCLICPRLLHFNTVFQSVFTLFKCRTKSSVYSTWNCFH